MRTAAYLLRVLAQSVRYALATRKIMLLVILLLAPVLVLLAMAIGVTSPFLVYPFV